IIDHYSSIQTLYHSPFSRSSSSYSMLFSEYCMMSAFFAAFRVVDHIFLNLRDDCCPHPSPPNSLTIKMTAPIIIGVGRSETHFITAATGGVAPERSFRTSF